MHGFMDLGQSGSCVSISCPDTSLQGTMGGHSKAVVCMDIEHTGSRVITGSLDYTIRMFDFGGMKSDLKAFRCRPYSWRGGGGLCCGKGAGSRGTARYACETLEA